MINETQFLSHITIGSPQHNREIIQTSNDRDADQTV